MSMKNKMTISYGPYGMDNMIFTNGESPYIMIHNLWTMYILLYILYDMER